MRFAQFRYRYHAGCAAVQHPYLEAERNRSAGKDIAMTAFTTLRRTLEKRAEYLRVKREIAALPVELAVEDLGIYPGDADEIARRAVYG